MPQDHDPTNVDGADEQMEALYTVQPVPGRAADPDFQTLLDDGILPIGVDSAGGCTGSTVEVNRELLQQRAGTTDPIPRNIALHTVCHYRIEQKDFAKWTRWYQEHGNTQVFRLFQGEDNVRNERRGAPRIEAFSDGDWTDDQWHEWEGTYTIVKPIKATLFQSFTAGDKLWSFHINMTGDGDVCLCHRTKRMNGEAPEVLASDMVGRSFHLKARDNRRDYEVYVNGELVGSGQYDRWQEGSRRHMFRWGMYAGSVPQDAMVFVTGARFK